MLTSTCLYSYYNSFIYFHARFVLCFSPTRYCWITYTDICTHNLVNNCYHATEGAHYSMVFLLQLCNCTC